MQLTSKDAIKKNLSGLKYFQMQVGNGKDDFILLNGDEIVFP